MTITFISSQGLDDAGTKMRAIASGKRIPMPPVATAQADLEIFAEEIQSAITAANARTSTTWNDRSIALALRELGSIAYIEAGG